MSDPLKPSMALLCKLSSALVHAAEFCSADSDNFDLVALAAALDDAEVREWVERMIDLGLAALPRRGPNLPEIRL